MRDKTITEIKYSSAVEDAESTSSPNLSKVDACGTTRA
jgi:hypothetical protein